MPHKERSDRGKQTPQDIANEVDKWLREGPTANVVDQYLRSIRKEQQEMEELDIEESATKLMENFLEGLKSFPEARIAISKKLLSTSKSEDPFYRFTRNGIRCAFQFINNEYGNSYLTIRKRKLNYGEKFDEKKERSYDNYPSNYWEESVLICLIRNRTASEDWSDISYADWRQNSSTGKNYLSNTVFVKEKAKAFLDNLKKPNP